MYVFFCNLEKCGIMLLAKKNTKSFNLVIFYRQGGGKMGELSISQNVDKKIMVEVIRYAARLRDKDLSRLGGKAQDIMILLLAEWTRNPVTKITIPLSEIRLRLGTNYTRRSILAKELASITRKIVGKSLITVISTERIYTACMIHSVTVDFEANTLSAECSDYFALLFSEAGKKQFPNYVTFRASDFISIRGKYAKNLFRLFSRNFQGNFSIGINDLRGELDISTKVDSGEIFRNCRSACKKLLDAGYFEKIDIKRHFADAPGRPMTSIDFTFTRSPEKSAEIAGQEQLPGLADDGAALSTQQAAPGEAAAPAPMPPAAAEKPLLTGENLIKPSAKLILQSIAADGLALPSGNAGGGKRAAPEIPHCPNCGGEMGIRNGRNGWFLYCKKCSKTMSGKPLQKMGLCFDQEGRLSWL